MLITHNAINLERPSIKSRSIVENKTKERINLNKHEKNILDQIKNELNIEDKNKNLIKKKKKKHGINPLSIKKKIKKNKLLSNSIQKKKRHRTRQIRMSKHLKEHLNELKKNFSIQRFLKIN